MAECATTTTPKKRGIPKGSKRPPVRPAAVRIKELEVKLEDAKKYVAKLEEKIEKIKKNSTLEDFKSVAAEVKGLSTDELAKMKEFLATLRA